jgi:hypothetical protein
MIIELLHELHFRIVIACIDTLVIINLNERLHIPKTFGFQLHQLDGYMVRLLDVKILDPFTRHLLSFVSEKVLNFLFGILVLKLIRR